MTTIDITRETEIVAAVRTAFASFDAETGDYAVQPLDVIGNLPEYDDDATQAAIARSYQHGTADVPADTFTIRQESYTVVLTDGQILRVEGGQGPDGIVVAVEDPQLGRTYTA